MYCTQCGAENADDSRFCRFCGHRLHPEGEKPAAGEAETAAPEQVSGLLARAFELLEAGRLDEAREVCLASLRLSPDSVTGRSLLAAIYERKGDLEAAIRQMERVVEMNPDSVADRNRLEDLRSRAGRAAATAPRGPAAGLSLPEALKRAPVAAGLGSAALALILLAIWLPGRARQNQAVTPPPPAVPAATAPSPESPSLFGGAAAPAPTPGYGGLFEGTGNAPQTDSQTPQNEGRTETRPEAERPASQAPRPAPQPPQSPPPARTPATGGANLPAPATPAPPQASGNEPRIVVTREPPPPPASMPPAPPRPAAFGRELQLRAMELKAAGQREQAIATFRQAIKAYEREAASGGGGFEAQQGIRTCLDEIQLLETP
jgi:tetratricopeptide (TPR) repeat protein